MFVQTYSQAVRQAKKNANYFQRPYAVFTDTSGNWRVETVSIAPKGIKMEVYRPMRQKKMIDKVKSIRP